MSSTTGDVSITKDRINSLDQYRGYAIFGMLLVNFFGHYKTKWVDKMDAGFLKDLLETIFGVQLHHHNTYMTYADTIAPIFMFVVGIGMRLSWTRRVQHTTPPQARKAMGKRYFTLVLIAFAIYTGWLWDALMSIGLAGLVALLIVDKKWYIRVAYALGLIVAFQLIFSYSSYGEWLLRLGKFGKNLDYPFITTFLPLREDLLSVPINGGLLGHWSWAYMLIWGTICYDIMATRDSKKILLGLSAAGIILSIAGWGVKIVGTNAYYVSAQPHLAAAILEGDTQTAGTMLDKCPGILDQFARGNIEAEKALKDRNVAQIAELLKPKLEALAAHKPDKAPRLANGWVFSKNYLTLPFPFWATALCIFHLLGFYLVCDVLKFKIPFMEVMGLNPLFIYIFQSLTLKIVSNAFSLGDLENTQYGTIVLGSFVAYFALVYGLARYLYNRNIIIKI